MEAFRKLRKDEVRVRVQSVTAYGATLLLYKDARCDMNILDETVGILGWKREHSRDNKNCTVSIWDAMNKHWVSREDTGSKSNAEAEKGLASDSFKRACTNLGIGRELYESPPIKLKKDMVDIKKRDKQSNGKDVFYTYDEFRVAGISYDRYGHVDGLAIKNKKTNKVVFLQEAKDKNWAEEKEDIPPIQTTAEVIDDKSVPKVEHVDVPFEEAAESVIIKTEDKPKTLESTVGRVINKFVESPEVSKANESGPGF